MIRHLRLIVSFQLRERNEDWPEKPHVLFRCDPAVIVVSLNWHEKKTEVGESIYHHLAMKYTDHEEHVRIQPIRPMG